MIKLTFNSTMNAIEFSEDNIKDIEDKFDVSIKKYVSYKVSGDDDRQHWEDVKCGDYVCHGEDNRHVQILNKDEFRALTTQAISVELGKSEIEE